MADLQPDNAAPDEAHIPWETLDGADEVAGLQDADGLETDATEPVASALEASDPLAEIEQLESAEPEVETAAIPEAATPAESTVTDTSPPAIESDPETSFTEPRSTGGWTITALCAGLALLACTVLIPQADANRRISYERQTLRNDLENVEKQIKVNQEFIRQVGQDPTLAERLARRQMKVIPAGNKLVKMPAESNEPAMSPFQLTNVGRPEPLPAYKPVGGFIARVCYSSHARLYLIGIALAMVATGLVLGGSSRD